MFSNSSLGAIWKIVGFACYAAINTITRYLSGGSAVHGEQILPINVIIFFQDSFALLFLVPWIIRQDINFTKIRFVKFHFARVFFSLTAITSWYFALFFIPQAEATALSIIGPIIGVMGAKWFLKEEIRMQRYFFILLSFILSLFAAWHFFTPSFNKLKNLDVDYSMGLICIILSTFLFASAKLLTRSLATKGESPEKLTAYLLVLMIPFSLSPALYFWVWPALTHIPWLILGGVLTTLAIYSVSKALTYAEISFLAPFDFIQFIFNTAMGYWVFTELPSAWILWGILSIILGNLAFLIFKFNRQAQT